MSDELAMGETKEDEDFGEGYPTEEQLEKIQTWDFRDPLGWMSYVGEIWAYKDWGWREKEVDGRWLTGSGKHRRYRISTAGWSGNESIIAAMMANTMLWLVTWRVHRAGGHFEFLVKL